jgi:hypothetical protein
LGVLYRADYRLKLVEEQRVRIDGPAVDRERIVAHASSSGSDASTSTSTPLTRALARDTERPRHRSNPRRFVRHVPREEFKELADHRIIPVGASFLFRDHDGTVGEPAKHNRSRLPRASILRIAAGTVAARCNGGRDFEDFSRLRHGRLPGL